MSKKSRSFKTAIASLALAMAFGGVTSVAAPAPAEAAGKCVNYNYSYGGYSSCVGNIQVLLNAFRPRMGSTYAPLAVDNKFGPATKAAVIKFQKFWGLTPDGIVGAQTWNSMCQPHMGPGPIAWYPYTAARASGCNI
ncbi:peptidoglycan hydrolase-like protein with peptidoglycan-binding domain [Arthrobacter stackebrandtii]|uniref:Peptidoglycan hydrolase-like protein with peptidoglycan-binding domain n=1 Tax=Arthrobacter stackebrandtii TaxID=272161 RepID=A0ABS4YSQ5_9MICC|nr:peptidoglycan-binding domain-containing protein [Arthrobacter stackebrandtii]MBP2411769.1 peptidoglycan hydrolase-like protein with peptidoglycan-binding domain [Arthrobacter stackebrandtii]PYG99161.1 hypothetical protein CVV67_16540 [Arthrobacter stackebrandtii]